MRGNTIRFVVVCGILFSFFFGAAGVKAQVGVFSKEDLIEYTPEWKGERFPDGRPKVPDDVLDLMKEVSLEEAWAVTERYGYKHQFESGWVLTHDNPVLVGRVVTGFYHPLRPDVQDVILADGKRDGRIGGQNSWLIDTLVNGDVLVVDLMGKVVNGTFLGDNLANAIYAKTGGNGVIIDGGNRDIQGVLEIPNFYIFCRGWDPSFLSDVMLMGINAPIRIGRATVMPGDIVLAKHEGVIFIPAQFAAEVVETSEVVRIRDMFGHQRLREGKYTPGQIDREWTADIEDDFINWVKKNNIKIDIEKMNKLLRTRTW